MQRFRIARLLLCLALLPFQTVQAQSAEVRASLTLPKTSQFPNLTTLLDIHTATGEFVHGLTAADVQLVEDNRALQVTDLEEEAPGVHVILAINAGPALGVRDGQGKSRYDRILQTLQTWSSAQPADTSDRFSLLTNTAAPARMLASASAWMNMVAAYQPDMRTTKPGIASLSAALDLAELTDVSNGMSQAVLYVTPPPTAAEQMALKELTSRLQAAGVRFFIWVVGTSAAENTPGVSALEDLAAQSGGQFFLFTGAEDPPNPEAYFQELRNIYRINYTSAMKTAGNHTLRAELTVQGASVSTPAISFPLDLQPPNPIFLSPPSEIVRTAPQNSRRPLENLAPVEQTLKILVEYPDGLARTLVRSTLLVDGEVAAENTEAPFDRFTWDLRGYTESGQHKIQVEVEDGVGMTRSTIELPVTITVVLPQPTFWTILSRSSVWIGLIALALAGSLLAAVLVRARRRSAQKPKLSRRATADPVTQPVPGTGETIRLAASQAKTRPQSPGGTARAHLIPLPGESVGESAVGEIAIHQREVTFGRDPSQVTCVLDALSVDALHARLRLENDRRFHLYDLGSVAGTWVNYAPISRSGVLLEENDVIHFGKLAYRFISQPSNNEPKPRVEEYKEPL